MSQSQALQHESETVMTPKETEQLTRIMERVDIANFYKEAWTCIDYPDYTEIVNRNHHEPHEHCSGHLLILEITGKPPYRHALSRLIARSPSMCNLLEKALPIIEAEADSRSSAFFGQTEPYWTEMAELANEIKAEIDKARGKTV